MPNMQTATDTQVHTAPDAAQAAPQKPEPDYQADLLAMLLKVARDTKAAQQDSADKPAAQ